MLLRLFFFCMDYISTATNRLIGFWSQHLFSLIFFPLGISSTGQFLPYKILEREVNPVADFLSANGGDKSYYRIWGLNMEDPDNQIYPDINLLYGFQSVSAYSNMWLKDYRDMTTFEVNGVSKSKYPLLMNSQILSTLSTKYIITGRSEDKEFLQRLSTGPEVQPIRIVVDGFDDPAWQFISPRGVGDEIIYLQSKTDDVSLIQIPFEFEPRTFYRVIFQARIPGRSPDSALTVDIAGDEYAEREREASFDSLSNNDYYTRAALSDAFQEYKVDFYSGEVINNSAWFAFIPGQTQSIKSRM